MQRSPRKPRRPSAVAAALLVLVLSLAGCGGDSSSDADAAEPPEPSVTIEHAFGTTTVEHRPQRIVSLTQQWTDVLLSMGVQPIGHAVEPQAGEGGVYPWQGELSADSVAIELPGDSIPLERVAALKPDLILVTYAAPDQESYDALAAIAPTIGLLSKDRQVDRWQDLTTVAGRFLREPQRAREVIAGVDQLMAATVARLPALEGKTFALVNYIPGDSLWIVADPHDGASAFFSSLGMTLDPAILAEAKGAAGRINVSLEQVAVLDGADLLVVFSNGGNPRDLVGYGQLPAVQSGAVADVEFAPVVGLNTPSPLSLPYSLDAIRPALEAIGAR